jgi:chemotaxis protein methyltransferase CheR
VEPFSLAILLELEAMAGQARIVATDISRAALARARKAAYGTWSFRDNHPDLAGRYFHRQGGKLVLIERIRRLVEFDTFNLASDAYPLRITGPGGLDVILCRNVLIYFDAAAVERVARQMFASLKDGGWLIAGPSDPPLWQHAPFDTVLTPAGVLYRRRDGAAARRQGPAGRRQPDVRAVEPVAASLPAQPEGPVLPARKAMPVRRKAAKAQPAGSHPPPETQSQPRPDTPAACIAALQAMANRGDPQRTAAAVANAVANHPLSPEIHYFQAIVLMSIGRYDEAAAALRRAIYLDSSMAVAHFALASIQQRRGSLADARRCYRNVLAACDQRRAEDIVPFSDGEPTGRLVEAARAQLALMRPAAGGRA